jgi:hypothetical protein
VLEIFANDLRAPNEPATYEAFQPALDGLLHALRRRQVHHREAERQALAPA